MAQYLSSVHGVESDFDPAAGRYGAYGSAEEAHAAMAATGAFNEKLARAGHLVFAGGLRCAHTATVVAATGDTPIFTDGPYLESKEYLGGFWVIEAPDLDVALALAAEGSAACRGRVEVRPFQSMDEPAIPIPTASALPASCSASTGSPSTSTGGTTSAPSRARSRRARGRRWRCSAWSATAMPAGRLGT
nr:YciI family protein [Conexibacter sp. DBS9H8]